VTDTHPDYITLATKTDWRPLLPPLMVLLAYHLWMPFGPGVWFGDLAFHQQAIAVSSTPTMFGSAIWWWKANKELVIDE
jgi:hypothetical protein